MMIEQISIKSRYHKHRNEDCYRVKRINTAFTVAVVADGMGGLDLGSESGSIVASKVMEYVQIHHELNDMNALLVNALEHADNKLREVSDMTRCRMGAAVAVAIVTDTRLFCVWQGNVRIYVQRYGSNKFITQDHIANIGYGRTALTRCIKGEGLRCNIPFVSLPLEKDDIILICTDGIYEPLESHIVSSSIEDIKEMLSSPEDDATLVRITI